MNRLENLAPLAASPFLNPPALREKALTRPLYPRHENIQAERGLRLNAPSALRRFAPLVAAETYLTATLSFFAFGPWPWPVSNPFYLYSYALLGQIALALGYLTTRRRAAVRYTGKLHVPTTIMIGAILTMIMFVPTLIVRTGGDINFVRGFSDPGRAYRETRLAVFLAPRSYVEYARYLMSPILWSLLPLTVVYWRRLSPQLRWLAVAACAMNQLLWVAIGTNKGIADYVLLLPWLFIVQVRHSRRALKGRQLLAGGIVLLIGLALFMPFFGSGIDGRYGGLYTGGMYLGMGGMIWADMPASDPTYISQLKRAWVSFMLYASHGYYGLALALQEPFESTYGFGHSRELIWVSEKLWFGEGELWNRTYMKRVADQYGWSDTVRWHTIYPWFASDFSFPGALVIIFIIGRAFGLVWLDAYQGNNPYAVVLLALIIIMVFYFSANNQVLQTAETFLVFWVALFLWILSRRESVIALARQRRRHQ
jgi:hypothetical protein